MPICDQRELVRSGEGERGVGQRVILAKSVISSGFDFFIRMSIFTVSQPRMAAVRPPAGGQSLKQNYDLDQVKGVVFPCGQFH